MKEKQYKKYKEFYQVDKDIVSKLFKVCNKTTLAARNILYNENNNFNLYDNINYFKNNNIRYFNISYSNPIIIPIIAIYPRNDNYINIINEISKYFNTIIII